MMVICFFVGIFIVRNTHSVWVNTLWHQGEIPVWSLVIMAMGLGMFISMLMQVFDHAAHRKSKRRLEREMDRLKQMLEKDQED